MVDAEYTKSICNPFLIDEQMLIKAKGQKDQNSVQQSRQQFEIKMLEEFQNILDEPHFSPEQILQSTRNLILNSLETNFPPDFNFDGLATLCNDPKIASNEALLTYHLVDYFIQLMQNNFISLSNYDSLEGQTQKLQSTIRSHIKLEQEVKMYLEHLEQKLVKYENYLEHLQKEPSYQSSQSIPSQVETQLRKQKVGLVKSNQQLKRKLQEKEYELKEKGSLLEEKMRQLDKLKHLRTDPFEGSTELLKRSLKLANVKSELRLQPMQTLSRSVNKGQINLSKVERVESRVYSKADSSAPIQDGQGLLINITGNNNEVNYYANKT